MEKIKESKGDQLFFSQKLQQMEDQIIQLQNELVIKENQLQQSFLTINLLKNAQKTCDAS